MREPVCDRREFLWGGLAAGGLALGLGGRRAAAAPVTVRLGFQTTIWGLPALVALETRSFEPYGVEIDAIRVTTGKIFRDLMVARRIDMGTFAGETYLVGAATGELAALGVVAYGGKATKVIARKDLSAKSVADLKGKRIGAQVGTSTTEIFVNIVAPKFGLGKGDYELVNTRIEDQISALAAKSIDAFVNVEPYTTIAELEAIGVALTDFSEFDPLPVLLGATQEFIEKQPEGTVGFLKGWLRGSAVFTEQPDRAADVFWRFYRDQGYNVDRKVFERVVASMDVRPEFTPELRPYLQRKAEILLEAGRIKRLPDWSKVLRPEFMERAKAAMRR